MKEIICINVGQTGVRIGSSFYDLLTLEHDIQPDGTKLNTEREDNSSVFFSQNEAEKYVPRSVFVDLVPEAINEVRRGDNKKLYNNNYFVYGKESPACYADASNGNVATKDNLFNQIKKLTEDCDNLEGFLIFDSIGGSTGSGIYSSLSTHLNTTYAKKLRIHLPVFPSPKLSNSVIEPYNAVLAHNNMIDNDSLTVLFDNEAIYNILVKKLQVADPSYININRLIAQAVASLTTGIRFRGPTNITLEEITHNLAYFPQIHFALPSYSPFTSTELLYHEQPSVSSITDSLFDPSSFMAKCNYEKQNIMSCCLFFRGDVNPHDVNSSILETKKKRDIRFCQSSTTGFKSCISSEPPMVLLDGDLAETMTNGFMLLNTGAISRYLGTLCHKFDKLIAKNAFVHWFMKYGISEDVLQEARSKLEAFINEYEEVSTAVTHEEEIGEGA